MAQPRHPRRHPGAVRTFRSICRTTRPRPAAPSWCSARRVTPRDFIYFYIGAFAGGGIVLNGGLYGGPTGNAGALGSMPVPGPDGKPRQLIDVASIAMLEKALNARGVDASQSVDLAGGLGRPRPRTRRLDRQRRAMALAYAIVAASSVIDFEAAVIDGWMPLAVRAQTGRCRRRRDRRDRRRGPGACRPFARAPSAFTRGRWAAPACRFRSASSSARPRFPGGSEHADRHPGAARSGTPGDACAPWAMATKSPLSTGTIRRRSSAAG